MIGRLRFSLNYALRSLRRDPTRTFLAALCIAFGVLSLVAMQLLATALLDAALLDPRLGFGGDAQLYSAQSGAPLSDAEIAQLDVWQADGLISAHTLVSRGDSLLLRTETSGRVTPLNFSYGIDPQTFPLIGQFTLSDPAGQPPAAVLRAPTDALLTLDIANQLGLQVGDTFLLGGGDLTTTRLTLAGILDATPNQIGKSVYYTLDTARLLENQEQVVSYASALLGDAPSAAQTIIDSPFRAYIAPDQDPSSTTNLFDLMLKCAGVLGLIVGSLGMANTLQVILARRKLEIAMLKTVGYSCGQLLALIGLETGLLGLVGSVVGGAAGVFVAGRLLDALSGAGTLMLAWSPDPRTVLGGILIGISTAVVFGLQAILASSTTRPVELLHDLPLKTPRRVTALRGALYGLLLLAMSLLVGALFGSLVQGVQLVIGSVLGLAVLRGVFWVLLWVVLRLPLPPLPTLRMTRNNLRYRKMQASLIVLALFAGTFSVTFAALTIYNSQTRIQSLRGADDGLNVMIYTNPQAVESISGTMALEGVADIDARYRLNGATLDGTPLPVQGRSALIDIEIVAGDWQPDDTSALLPALYRETYPLGTTVELTANGASRSLTVTGYYERAGDWSDLLGTTGVIVSTDVARALGSDRMQVQVMGAAPVETLDRTTTALGLALPDTLVFSKADINEAMIVNYRSLFTFAVSIAGLAFVAGAVLIANAAGLTVVERRREIGVFKAVGYTAGRVLRLLLSEYALLGLLAGVIGTVAVIVAVTLINIAFAVQMVVEPTITVAMIGCSVGVSLVSAALIAWRPTHVRPMDVLRYE